MLPLAAADRVLWNFPTNLSRSISLAFFAEDGAELYPQATTFDPIELILPLDPKLQPSLLHLQNVTGLNGNARNPPFNLHYVALTGTHPMSIQLQIHALNSTLAYLLTYAFDRVPEEKSAIDGWTRLCPSSESLRSDAKVMNHPLKLY